MIKKLLLSGCLFFTAAFAFSQDTPLGNWFVYSGNSSFNERWSWWHEVQYRNYNFIGDLEQIFIRTALQYNLSENNNTISLGYGYFKSEPYIIGELKDDVNEHRIYQQFLTKQQFDRVYITHRYRLEQRFIEDVFRIRFRYSLSLNVPLNKPALDPGAVYLSAYNEVFLHEKTPVFDRNRLYGGLGYAIKSNLRFETGLMYQLLESTKRPQWQLIVNHTINWK